MGAMRLVIFYQDFIPGKKIFTFFTKVKLHGWRLGVDIGGPCRFRILFIPEGFFG
jgi:hypothetical protein